MINSKIAMMAIPIITAIMIGGVLPTTNASGPTCDDANVYHALVKSKSAYAFFPGEYNVSFYYGLDNCSNEGKPTMTVYASVYDYNTSTNCFSGVIEKSDIEWGYEYSSLTIDGTVCGDILVEWWGDGEMMQSSGGYNNETPCVDGKYVNSYFSKYQDASTIVSIDGSQVASNPLYSYITQSSDMVLDCTGD